MFKPKWLIMLPLPCEIPASYPASHQTKLKRSSSCSLSLRLQQGPIHRVALTDWQIRLISTFHFS